MPPQLQELPLFPLNTVLFPFASLRLHIFEERYREMVRRCLRDEIPFGIVLIRAGSEIGDIADPYMVGTSARIVEAETYEDGRMDIQVHGERRFRVRALDETSQPYLVGMVEPIFEQEMSTSDEAERLIREARNEFEILIQRVFAREHFGVRVEFPPDPVALSFTIANLLPIENLDKQRMLETTDTLDRMESLLPLIRAQIQESRGDGFNVRNESGLFKLTTQDLREWISPN
jgi:Lon protease-like protein